MAALSNIFLTKIKLSVSWNYRANSRAEVVPDTVATDSPGSTFQWQRERSRGRGRRWNGGWRLPIGGTGFDPWKETINAKLSS